MNAFYVIGFILGFIAILFGWAWLAISVDDDEQEMAAYERRRRWFEDQFK